MSRIKSSQSAEDEIRLFEMRGLERALLIHEETVNDVETVHEAAFKGDIETLKTLLIRNENKEGYSDNPMHVNFPHPTDGRTVLHSATQGLPSRVIEFLVKSPYHANIEAQDVRGRTPLLHACALGQPRLFTRLVALGADPYAEDIEGMGAGLITARAGHINMIRWLHQADVDIHSPTKDGRTALHMAAFAGQTDGNIAQKYVFDEN
jgi:ankyrin repeat protein